MSTLAEAGNGKVGIQTLVSVITRATVFTSTLYYALWPWLFIYKWGEQCQPYPFTALLAGSTE